MMKLSADSVAGCIARVLKARGIERVFALCGGHIMPIWMRLDAEGIRIIDVRDERAAVHMAQAQAELTGELGVALATAEPGVTNARPASPTRTSRAHPFLFYQEHRPARRKTAVVCRMSTTRFCCVASRAMPAPCASLRWCWQSSTKPSHGPLANAGSLDRPTSTFRPIPCGPRFRRPCSSQNTSRPNRAPTSFPTLLRSIGLWMFCGRQSEC